MVIVTIVPGLPPRFTDRVVLCKQSLHAVGDTHTQHAHEQDAITINITTYTAIADVVFIASRCELSFKWGVHPHRRTAAVCVPIGVTHSSFARTKSESNQDETKSQQRRQERHDFLESFKANISQTAAFLLKTSTLRHCSLQCASVFSFRRVRFRRKIQSEVKRFQNCLLKRLLIVYDFNLYV